MKNTIQIISLFFICLFIGSCKKDATAPAFDDIPVVQSYLQVGSPATVNISKLISFDPNAQYAPDNVNSLNINITSNGITYLLNPVGGGNYVDSSLIISDTAQYSLQFNYNGKTVSATTKALSKPTGYTQSLTDVSIAQIPVGESAGEVWSLSPLPDPIVLDWNNPDHSYYIVVVENTETNPQLINLNEAGLAPRVFRNQPTQDDNYQVSPRSFQYYGVHKLTLYHVLPEYADLYKSDGTSSQNLTTPTTSVINGLGVFTAINVATLYVTVHKL